MVKIEDFQTKVLEAYLDNNKELKAGAIFGLTIFLLVLTITTATYNYNKAFTDNQVAIECVKSGKEWFSSPTTKTCTISVKDDKNVKLSGS